MSVRPYVDFKPTTPQREEGIRTEPVFPLTIQNQKVWQERRKVIHKPKSSNVSPPPSVPNAAEHSPEATIAAGPEEDPPVYLSGACGFLAVL